MPQKHDICECNHYYFLHDEITGECAACDTPEIPILKKCPGFRIKEVT